MASSRGSSYASSQETTNFARICRIVVDVLRDILWQVLIYEIPAGDLPNRVQKNLNILGKLDNNIKTWLCGISPTSPEIPIAEKFDVTSLYTLIRNLCSQVPTPSIQWGKTPPPGGTTLGDDIERVRGFRNKLYGHATQAEINSADFNTLCIDIKNVVCRFDAYFSSKCRSMKCDFKNGIDTILTCSMDRNLQDTYIDKMAEIGILSDDLENVKQQVGNVEQQFVDVKQKVGDIEWQVGDVKHQVGDIKQQVGNVEQQVGSVEQQVGDVKQQVGDVKQQVGNVEEQVGNVKQQVGSVEQQVADVKLHVGNVDQEVGDVKQHVRSVEKQVGDVKQHVGSVEKQVGDVKQHVGSVEKQAGDVKQHVGSVEKQVEDVKQQVTNVEQQVGNVQQQVGDVKQQVGDVKQQVGSVEQQVVDVKQHVGNVEQQVGDVKQHVGSVEKQVEDVKQQVGDVKQQVGNVEQQVGSVEQQVGDVKQQVGSVKQHVDEVKQQIGDVKQYVGNVEQQVGNVKDEIEDVEQQVGDVKQQVGNVEQQVGNVKQQVGNVEQQVEAVKQHVGSVEQQVDEVKQQVKQKVGDVEQQVADLKKEIPVVWNFTAKDILETWSSIEYYLLEELAPVNILSFFENESLLSAKNRKDICKLTRRQMAKEVLQRIKANLPEAFLSFLRALNEAKQDFVVNGLRQQIDHHQTNAVLPSIAYYTLKIELLKEGKVLHETESKTKAYLEEGSIVFDYEMRSQCLKWEAGSVIIYLRPLSKSTKETLECFCENGGIKDFVLDLLNKNDIFSSLPEGEMSIQVQVHSYNQDSESEGADELYRDYTQMIDKHSLSQHGSFTVTDDPRVIKENLRNQFCRLVEEIEPLHIIDTFENRGVWDTRFYEELKMIKERKKRATHFLRKVFNGGNTALATLVHTLRNKNYGYLADSLCITARTSSQVRDKGQVNSSLIKVIQEDSATYGHESMVWSCSLVVEVRKDNEARVKKAKEKAKHEISEKASTIKRKWKGKAPLKLRVVKKKSLPLESNTSQSDESGTHASINTGSAIADKTTEANKKHCLLRCTLDGLITSDSLRNIKIMANTYLDLKTLEKIESMDDLFIALQKKGKVGVGNYDVLVEIMKCAGVEIGIDEIHKTAKDIKGILDS